MGYGSYSYEAHRAITSARTGQDTNKVFSTSVVHPSMDPKGVRFRESRDSDDNPNSLGIVFALDISGSMSKIPVQIACDQLPNFMKLLTDCDVPDPQVLFMALTDVQRDGRPLQVGQFETTAKLMDQWLTRCSLKGGGTELYELAFHFVARHTAMDCWNLRKKKGYLFMTGDEPANRQLSRAVVARRLGTEIHDMPLTEVIAEVKETFHPFFLIPDAARARSVAPFWKEFLGDYTICLQDPVDTCSAAAALVALSEGAVEGLAGLEQRLKDLNLNRRRTKAVITAVSPWALARGLA